MNLPSLLIQMACTGRCGHLSETCEVLEGSFHPRSCSVPRIARDAETDPTSRVAFMQSARGTGEGWIGGPHPRCRRSLDGIPSFVVLFCVTLCILLVTQGMDEGTSSGIVSA